MILRLSLNEITRYLTELFMLSGQMELLEETKSHISIGFSPGLSVGKAIYIVVPLRIPCKHQGTTLSLTFNILDISMIFLAETRTLCTTLVK